jgi:hypothetical protein
VFTITSPPPFQQQASGAKLAAAQRVERAIELRVAGLSFTQIGQKSSLLQSRPTRPGRMGRGVGGVGGAHVWNLARASRHVPVPLRDRAVQPAPIGGRARPTCPPGHVTLRTQGP